MSVTSSPSSSPASLFSLRTHSSSVSSWCSRCTSSSLLGNTADPAAKWLVQKFGGTSVGKFATRIAEDIVSTHLGEHKIAIVCSARSGSTKSSGTTNLLLRAAAEALQRSNTPPDTPSLPSGLSAWVSRMQSPVHTPGTFSPRSDGSWTPAGPPARSSSAPAFHSTVETIREEHLTAARASVADAAILRALEAEIDQDCDELRAYLFATQVVDEITPRSKDYIVGFGERLSCRIMTAVLQDRGMDAEFVNLEDIVLCGGPEVEESEVLTQAFYDHVASAVAERIKQCGSRIPVVTGFFGPVPGSLLQQIGRGYTDLLAALLAAGLGAEELQIWKEVDGIFTADPHKVPTARVIPAITPEEAAELTYYGSEVVHPFTMEQVTRKDIPIRIKNVQSPRGQGTVIRADQEKVAPVAATTYDKNLPASRASPTEACPQSPYNPFASPALPAAQDDNRRLPSAVTVKEHIVVLNVNSNRKSVSHGFLAKIFATLERYGVAVDLITTSEVHVSMAVEEGRDKRSLDRAVRDLRKTGTVTVRRDMAILSLVGKEMRHKVGIAGRMLTTLGQRSVNIEMISQGASEINISCVINGRDAVKALNLIHQSCLQIRPPGFKV